MKRFQFGCQQADTPANAKHHKLDNEDIGYTDPKLSLAGRWMIPQRI